MGRNLGARRVVWTLCGCWARVAAGLDTQHGICSGRADRQANAWGGSEEKAESPKLGCSHGHLSSLPLPSSQVRQSHLPRLAPGCKGATDETGNGHTSNEHINGLGLPVGPGIVM